MNYALVENGVVVNVIVADADFVAIHFPDAVRIDLITPEPGIGWRYVNGTLTAPPQR